MIDFSTLQCKLIDTPLGSMAAAASERGMVGLWFVGQQHFPDHWPGLTTSDQRPASLPPHPPTLTPTLAAQHLNDTQTQLALYFQGQLTRFSLPCDVMCGTAFQRDVWTLLQDIAYGTTCSYGQLARSLGKPGAARAIGLAVGRNPLSVVIPCHRVVGAQGQLTGYAGGVVRKRALLDVEARA